LQQRWRALQFEAQAADKRANKPSIPRRTMSSSIASPVVDAAGAAARPPADAPGQLAKLETQLSDWTHCESSKTTAGQQKIAAITAAINTLKAQVRQADEARAAATTAPALRFDGVGARLDLEA
jgi:hypothetical protein